MTDEPRCTGTGTPTTAPAFTTLNDGNRPGARTTNYTECPDCHQSVRVEVGASGMRMLGWHSPVRTFHFRFTVDATALVKAESRAAALVRLKWMLPESWDTDDNAIPTLEGQDVANEYVAVHFEPTVLTDAHLDEEDYRPVVPAQVEA